MQITHQSAWITGAGTGVGRAVAEALAKEGIRVALVGRREEKLRETEARIRSLGGEAKVFVADVRSLEAMEMALANHREIWGDPLILVNNAGVHGEFTPITRSDPLRWRETMEINLLAPYQLCRLCVPAMLQCGEGRIINVSSASGLAEPNGMNSAYSLSKYALNYLTRQMAQEVEGTGVSCTAIHPGEVQTEMWGAIMKDSESQGPEAADGQGWSKMVEETGGDPPEKAADLVMKILKSDAREVNGKFMWIEDGIQTPRATW